MKNWFKKLQFALVRIGKEKKWLKYPVTLLLAIMFAVCEIFDAVKTLAYPKIRRRILASVLACCMIFTLIPTAAFAAEPVQGVSSVCTHHTGHITECGYTEELAGTPCGFVLDAPEEASPSNSDKPETEPTAHVHNEECGYIEAVEGVPCGFVCDICNQEPEQKDCNCLPVDSGEVTHGEDCPLYLPAQSDCICPPVDSGELTHGEDCPLYEKLVPEQADAVKAVLVLIAALPTMDELAAVDTENEGFADYLMKLRLDTAAARTAFDALTDEEKAELDPAVLAKLTELEGVLAAMPVLMNAAIPTLGADNVYQNVKYTLTAGSPNTAAVLGIANANNVLGINNVLTIPAQVKTTDGTIYDVTKISSRAFEQCSTLTAVTIPIGVTKIEMYAFYNCTSLASVTIPDGIEILGDAAFLNCTSLASVTIPSSVTAIGQQAFSNIKSGATVTLEHKTFPSDSGISAGSFINKGRHAYYIIANPAIAKAISESYDNNENYGIFASEVPSEFTATNANLKLLRPADVGVGNLWPQGGYNVLGVKDGTNIATTYENSGYQTYLSTDTAPARSNSHLVRLPGGGAETYAKRGIWVKADGKFVSGGKYLRVTYTMRNSTDADISSVSLGVNADVKIGDDDNASIYPTPTGFRMVDTRDSGMQFTLNCKNAPSADDVSTMWYGAYGSMGTNLFTDLTNKKELIGVDSVLTFSWKGMTIPANGEITRSVVFGVSAAATPPALPTDPDSKPIALYLTTVGDKEITVNAKVTDTAGLTDTLYYTINDGEEQQLGETVTANGSEQVISGNIAASNFTDDGTYTVKLWIMNSKGAMSEVITKVLTVSSGAMGGAGLETGTAPVSPGGGTPPAADKITIKVNNGAEVGGADLKTAIGSTTLSSITNLEITKGEVTAADWDWFAGGTPETGAPVLSNLTDFTVESAVISVEDIPTCKIDYPIFPKTITTVNIPQIVNIGDYAFNGCKALTSAIFPMAKNIGRSAFYDCTKLATVNLSAATNIGQSAFYKCAVQTVNFSVVLTIGASAFNGCTALASANFPMADSIGASAFSGCTALTNASFPALTTIGNYAFSGCTALNTLKLGAKVPTIVNANAFTGCPKTTLIPVDVAGDALTEVTSPMLSVIAANYDKVASTSTSTDTGSDTDGLWYGWKVREPVVTCTCTLSAPTFVNNAIIIPADQATATHALTAGSALGGSCAEVGHSGTTIAYSFAEKTGTSNIASITGTTLTVTGAGSVTVTATATANGKTATKDATFTVTKAVAPKITIKINDVATEHIGATLQAAVDTAKGSNAYAYITKLTITGGEVTTADWTWFFGDEYSLKLLALTDFTINESIADNNIADIPDQNISKFVTPKIEKITIPQEIKIGIKVFSGYTALTSVSFQKVKDIGESAFQSCKALTSVSFPAATSIGEGAFGHCVELTNANFPKAATIGESAFILCEKLDTISFPKATTIGASAFQECPALTSASFPEVTSAGKNSFFYCKELASADFPKLEAVGEWMFMNTKLETISFPVVKTIGERAFEDCTQLAELELGATPPSSVGTSAFTNCPVDRNLTVSASAVASYKAAADGDTTDNLWYGWTISGGSVAADKITITVTDGANTKTDIGGTSLSDAITKSTLAVTAITKLTITKGEVTAADWTWFAGNGTPVLSKLTDFTVESAVTTVANIPDGAYSSPIFPKSIVNATIPKAIKIGNYAFKGCYTLATASFPAATSIGQSAFYDCTVLTTIDFTAATSIGTSAFFACKALTTASFPVATSIGQEAFQGCTLLSTASFPLATSVGYGAFQGCKALATASFPAAKEILDSAFSGCTSLATLKLGATVPTTVGRNAFSDCLKTTLTLVDASGTALTEDTSSKLSVIAANYDKVASTSTSTDTGTATDGLWFGWKVRESIISAIEAEWTPTGGVKANGTLLDGFAALKTTGGTIKLVADITKTQDFSGTLFVIDTDYLQPIIFDLAGKKLAFTGGNQSTALFFVQGNTGLFTITDSSAGKTGGISMVNGFVACADKTAKLALSGGTYTASGSMGNEYPVLGAIARLGSDDNPEEQKATLNSFCVQGFVFSPATLSFDAVTAAMHTAATVKVVPVAPIVVTGVTLNKTALSLAAGKSETLTATIAPATATNTAVTWSSSNPANATVDANGKVTALTAGSTTITVTTTDGGKTATCVVTVTAATTKPAPGGKLEAPLTQDKVNDVFGEGNATLDGTTTPPTIKLEKDITPEKPIEIETDVKIDLGGNTITGKPGQPPIIVGDNDKVTIDGSGTIAGGDSTTGNGGNGITGGAGSGIIIGGGVTVEGGDGTTGGDGINSGGNVTVGGDVNGGNGSAGNSGDGVDTSTGSGNITIDNGGSASGGNGGNGSATGGNGGNGTNSGSGSTTVDGETTGGNGGNGTTGGGSGGDGSTSTGGGSITVDGETTGGTGGNASSGTGGNGGDGSETSGNTDINSGGSSTGGAGGNGSVTGGNGGSGTSGGNVNVDGGGTTTGGTGGSGSATGGNGGNGTDGNNTTINGGTTGGNGGNGNGNGSGGNGGNGTNQGSGTVGGGGTATGGDGGNGAGTGNGGSGGAGVGGGAGAGSVTTKPGAKGRKATAEVDDSKSGTTVTVPNESKLADAALTEAEKKDPAITEVKVVLNVEKKNNQPDKSEVDRILSSEAADIIGAFFDITLDKIITNAGGIQPPVGVANASEEIEITITIPSDMRGGSNYVVIRVHNGAGAALSTTQSGDDLTFKTDKFSTYAIAYTKTGGTTPPTPPSGGGDDSGGSGGSYIPPITVTPSDKPNMPTTAETEVEAAVDQNGNAAVTLPVDTVEAAVKKAVDEAKKAGKTDNGIAVVINVSTGGSNASSMSVNLPKATQEYIISNKVSQITFVVKSPAISMGLNLAAVTEINRQAQADVQLTATRLTNTTGMSAAAKAAIGTRPVFALSATYQNGTKAISNVGSGMIAVAIPYTPSSKENTGNLYAVYADEHGEVNYLTESSYYATNKAVIFSASHFRTYAVGYKAIAFTDISGHWAKDHIEFAANRGLLLDIDTNIFSPNTPMTRAMFVTALGRLTGIDSTKYKISTFTDVKADAYYAPYVTWAAGKNIVNGTTATIFAPDQAITRQEMAVIMQNYAKAMNYTVPKTREPVIFEDNGGIGSRAAEAVKAMQMAGVITGKDGNKFDPTGTATRAEVAAVLHRYVELVIDKATAQGLDINDSGKIVYYENGKLFTGTKTIDGTTYHFGSDGICTETDAVVPKTEKYITHIMVYGDTIWKLSRKHKCTVAEIVGMNGIKDPNNVPVGTKIKIPQK